MKDNYRILLDDNLAKFVIILKSLLVGVLSGGVVVLYRILLSYSEHFALEAYGFLKENIKYVPIAVIALFIAAFVIWFLIRRDRLIVGSGIPQIEGILKGYFRERRSWWQTILGKFVGGAIGVASGLSLGREGPSIQIGACVAEGIGKKSGKSNLEKKMLMACGASAGLAAAFNAPMAGVIFVLEEVFKYFSPIILLSAMSSAVAADFVSKQIFGLEPIFHFDITSAIPLNSYWILIIMGIFLGIMGAFYNQVLLKLQDFYGKVKVFNKGLKVFIPFAMALALGLFFPIVLGGGHGVIDELTPSRGLMFLVIIFLVKFVFSIISFASGTPGGIFFPLLILGATLGATFSVVSIQYLGVSSEYFNNLIVIAMVGYFTAIVRAPITGIVLIMEMTGSFTSMLSFTVVAVISYFVADRMSPPIYDALLDKMIEKEHPEEEYESSTKCFIEMIVQHDSEFEDKKVKEIPWPYHSVLVGIRRGKSDLLPKGETKVKCGDYLIVLVDRNQETKISAKLKEMNHHD